MKSLCVFCGANFNGDLILGKVIHELAEVMVNRNITLVFGGGKVGVMGILADAILTRGGKGDRRDPPVFDGKGSRPYRVNRIAPGG